LETASVTPVRVAIYCRVSTTKQEVENQLDDLTAYAAARGWTLAPEHVLRETAHGWDPDRKKLQELLALVRARKVDAVLVWAIDRFSRQGVLPTLKLIEEIRQTGCRFYSLKEEFVRDDNPLVDVFLSLMAWTARQEHVRVSERTKAGLARVRKEARSYGAPKGRRPIGRAPVRAFNKERARELRTSGLSWSKVLLALNLPPASLSSVQRACRPSAEPTQRGAADPLSKPGPISGATPNTRFG
jgi:DNA invertase Pin-like site-specific DNA recombinase